jgi:hypothetical protein
LRGQGRVGVWLFLVVLANLGFPGLASGAGLRDIRDSWLISPEDVCHLLAGTATWGDSLHFAGSHALVELGQGRLFSVPGLEQSQVSMRLRGPVRGCAMSVDGGWQKFGSGVFREDQIWLAFSLGDRPGLGLEISLNRNELDGQPRQMPLGLSLIVEHFMGLGDKGVLRGELNLTVAPGYMGDYSPARNKFAAATLIRPGGALGMRIDRRPDGTPVLGFEVFLRAGPGTGFSLRGDPATGSLGPGIQTRRGILLLRTSHLFHPDLGQTHRFSLCLVRGNG